MHAQDSRRFARWVGFSVATRSALAWLFAAASVSIAPASAETNSSADQPAAMTVSSSGVSDQSIIAFINAEIAKGWQDAGITPAMKATDSEWCRRAYLDVIGRIPTVAELKRLLGTPAATRKAELLDRLLDSENDDSLKEYARNWTGEWTNVLIGRPPAKRDRKDPTNREGMQQYLRSSFLRNKPYDRLVFELISATGNTAPGQSGYNGATNFLVNKMKENGTEATAKTAKYFLGLQVQCTQCHNHPFNEWKQDQYWGMNAFFRQTHVQPSKVGREIETTLLSNSNFAGEGSTPGEAEIYFEKRNGELQVAYPTFIDGTRISASGYLKDVDRRTELAKLVMKSPLLGKAVVNRYWAHFLGQGFTKPVDDIGPHNAPSHSDLLERLGREFSSHGYDLKRLIRWIALSEPYALSSKMTAHNAKDDPSLGEKPKFSHFYLRQMHAEQLYESMMLIAHEHQQPGSYEEREGRKADLLRQFTLTFGNDEGDEATMFN
ncbi:MAG TPA: DUF1549 domain-containing protein, partial [Pirellulales bacterium]|nr:DUF1549 domain-containing protein [Pirellulales bacterium]